MSDVKKRVEDECIKIIPRFRSIAKEIWGEGIDKIEFKCEPKTDKIKYFASLSHDARCKPYAVGNLLYRHCKEYTLQLSPRFLELSDRHKERVLRHEALHIGHSRHTVEFIETAFEVNASVSDFSLDKNEIVIEAKGDKGRYEKVTTASTIDEAKRIGRQYAKDHNKKVRITF